MTCAEKKTGQNIFVWNNLIVQTTSKPGGRRQLNCGRAKSRRIENICWNSVEMNLVLNALLLPCKWL